MAKRHTNSSVCSGEWWDAEPRTVLYHLARTCLRSPATAAPRQRPEPLDASQQPQPPPSRPSPRPRIHQARRQPVLLLLPWEPTFAAWRPPTRLACEHRGPATLPPAHTMHPCRREYKRQHARGGACRSERIAAAPRTNPPLRGLLRPPRKPPPSPPCFRVPRPPRSPPPRPPTRFFVGAADAALPRTGITRPMALPLEPAAPVAVAAAGVAVAVGSGGGGAGAAAGAGAGAAAGAALAARGFLDTAEKLDMSGMGLLDVLWGDGVDAVRPGVDLLRDGRLGGPGPDVRAVRWSSVSPGATVAARSPPSTYWSVR